MQIVHHSTDATQRREAERLAERKGNEEKENSHPKEIEAGQGSSRAAIARAQWFQRCARRWLLGTREEGN
jgi:ABC-type polar amino acid transport system ATPase subunit